LQERAHKREHDCQNELAGRYGQRWH
jgi:hypothetical protein